MEINYVNIITLFLSAAGFWKFIEMALKFRTEKRLKKAETGDVFAHANSQIVTNWMEWSKKLEERIKELESKAKEFESLIEKQRLRIGEMEKHINSLEKHNAELSNQIEELISNKA